MPHIRNNTYRTGSFEHSTHDELIKSGITDLGTPIDEVGIERLVCVHGHVEQYKRIRDTPTRMTKVAQRLSGDPTQSQAFDKTKLSRDADKNSWN